MDLGWWPDSAYQLCVLLLNLIRASGRFMLHLMLSPLTLPWQLYSLVVRFLVLSPTNLVPVLLLVVLLNHIPKPPSRVPLIRKSRTITILPSVSKSSVACCIMSLLWPVVSFYPLRWPIRLPSMSCWQFSTCSSSITSGCLVLSLNCTAIIVD